MNIHVFTNRKPGTIVVAACDTAAEAAAMMRWIGPVLPAGPRNTWAAWLAALLTISTGDPVGLPFKQPFPSFGVRMAS